MTRNLFGRSLRAPPCWFAGTEQSSFAYAASSAAVGVVSGFGGLTSAAPLVAEADGDALAEAEVAGVDAAADGLELAARWNAAGCACAPPWSGPSAFGLVAEPDGDTELDGEVEGVADGETPDTCGAGDTLVVTPGVALVSWTSVLPAVTDWFVS